MLQRIMITLYKVKISVPTVLILYYIHSWGKKDDAHKHAYVLKKKNEEGKLTLKNALKIIFNSVSS